MGNCVLCIKPKQPAQHKQIPFLTKQTLNKVSDRNENKIDKGKNVRIRTNPKNMKLIGVPKEWVEKKYCDKNIIDQQKMVEDQVCSAQEQSRIEEVGDLTISSMAYNQPPKQDFRHIGNSIITVSQHSQINNEIRNSDIVVSIHGSIQTPTLKKSKSNAQINEIITKLKVDQNSKYGIKNLPTQWACMMQASGLSDADVKQNPQAMLDLIKSQSFMDLSVSKGSAVEQKLISYQQFLEVVHQVQVIYYNPVKQYEFKKRLGSGAMCQVFQVVSRKQKIHYAVRIMKNKKPEDLPKIQQQIAIMKLCESQNIVKHIETYFYNNIVYMFIEYMDAGSLTNLIEKSHNNIPQSIIAYILREIIKGVAVLHKKRRIHRDIKSDNVLLGSNGEIKIADFGFATQLTKEKQRRNTLVGTPSWMAPQLVKKLSYNQKVDVWSIGVVILELINGQPPYLRLAPLKAMYQIASKQIPNLDKSRVSEQLHNFYIRCMQKNPDERASCRQLLKHNFLIKHENISKNKFKQFVSHTLKF